MTRFSRTNFRSTYPWRLHIKFGFHQPRGFRGEDLFFFLRKIFFFFPVCLLQSPFCTRLPRKGFQLFHSLFPLHSDMHYFHSDSLEAVIIQHVNIYTYIQYQCIYQSAPFIHSFILLFKHLLKDLCIYHFSGLRLQ